MCLVMTLICSNHHSAGCSFLRRASFVAKLLMGDIEQQVSGARCILIINAFHDV